MYLSQLNLNPMNRRVQRDLGDCHQLHRTIMRGFPLLSDSLDGNHSAREHFGVLYRLEPEGRDRALKVLVQSRTEPDWSKLETDYVAGTQGAPAGYRTTPMERLLQSIIPGQPFAFRLRANPTKRILQQKDPRTNKVWDKKRVNLYRDEDLLAWIERKSRDSGFELLTIRAAPETPDRIEIPDTRCGKSPHLRSHTRNLTFGSVLFEGRLRVTDAEVFRETLARGIGSGKAYGFGLLSIARAG